MSKKRTPPENPADRSPVPAGSNTSKTDIDHTPRTAHVSMQYSGPLPPPQYLDGYNRIVPDGAERLFKIFEDESKHIRELEHKKLHAATRETLLGQIFGLAIGLAALALAGFAIHKGSTVAGSIIGGGTIVGLVSVFVSGRAARQGRKESLPEQRQAPKN